MAAATISGRGPAKPERLALRPDEAAAVLGISRAKCYVLMKVGEIPFFMMGGNRRIRPSALTDYVERLERESAAPTAR
jgi:excisionase family DNA binding protein